MSAVKSSKLPAHWSLQTLALRVLAEIIGLAQDFWHDPPSVKANAKASKLPKRNVFNRASSTMAQPSRVNAQPDHPRAELNSWTANRPQILEKIWGDGEVAPGGDYLNKMLVAPLGLTAEYSVLDLAAGLGNFARLLASKFGVYVTGLESDPQLADAGMAISVKEGKAKHAPISPYELASFKFDRPYDCVIARELLFRVPNKKTFFEELSASIKSKGQFAFTDFIVEPAERQNTAILEWLGFEAGAAPLALDELKVDLKLVGLEVRVADDQTRFYQQEILHALARFAQFLRLHHMDEATRVMVKAEIELWARREAALGKGLKFYRFHALKME